MKIFLYLCPIIVNYILGGIGFIAADRFARAGAPDILVGATMTVWSLSYTLSTFLIGRRTTERNAPYMVISGALLIGLNMLGFLVFDQLYLQFLWLALNGIFFSLYCCPFQVFMKMMESRMKTEKQTELTARTAVIRSASFYTASWSIGMAVGPFIFGHLAPRLVYALNIVFSLVLATGLFIMNKAQQDQPSTANAAPSSPVQTASNRPMPDMVRCAWSLCFMASFISVTLRTMLPVRAVECSFSTGEAGTLVFAAILVQAAVALSLVRAKGDWMYHPLATALPIFCGLLAMLLFAFGTTMGQFLAAALLFGICAGTSFFLIVFHALIHPTKSGAYVAINEVVDGTTNMTAPLIGGFAMTLTAFPGASFLLAGAVVLGVMTYTTLSFRKVRVE